MAFPSSTAKDSLASAWTNVQHRASHIKATAQEIRNASAVGGISAKLLVDYSTMLAESIVILDKAASIPGISQYAKDQIGDQTLDVVVEFNAMRAEIVAARDWIVANFPKDGSGFLLFISFTPDGRFTFRQLTSAQTVGLRTQLDSLIATIS